VKGSRDSRFEALGFFIVSAIGKFAATPFGRAGFRGRGLLGPTNTTVRSHGVLQCYRKAGIMET